MEIKVEKKKVKVDVGGGCTDDACAVPTPKEAVESVDTNAPLSIQDAINYVQRRIGAISKTRRNKDQGNFLFRGIDDVYNAVQGPMAEAGLYWRFDVALMKSERIPTKSGGTMNYACISVDYNLCHRSGTQIEHFSTIIAEGLDVSDKAIPKAMSMAHKTVMLQAFCVATDEPKDPEDDRLATPTVQAAEPKHDATPKQDERDPFTEALLYEIKSILEATVDGVAIFTPEQVASVRALVKKNPSRTTLLAIRDQWAKKCNATPRIVLGGDKSSKGSDVPADAGDSKNTNVEY